MPGPPLSPTEVVAAARDGKRGWPDQMPAAVGWTGPPPLSPIGHLGATAVLYHSRPYRLAKINRVYAAYVAELVAWHEANPAVR